MNIQFVKYQGAGNDFILVDDRVSVHRLSELQIQRMCDRHMGIGADGLLLLRNKSGVDFEMVYYNSDGRLASMCGNGSRCIVAFAKKLGIIKSDLSSFIAADGIHEARILDGVPAIIRVKMGDVPGAEMIGSDVFLNTGSPHYVCFIRDVQGVDVRSAGREIRYNSRFKVEGTNVNFAEPDGRGLLVRTYERGVEDETLSCGTGVIAATLAAVTKGILSASSGHADIRTPGGLLKVFYQPAGTGFREIWLEGPAEFVFRGEIEI